MRTLMLAATAALLAGCSEPAAEKKPEKAAALQPGEYEVAIKVDDVRSTDKTTPATTLKAGTTGEPVRTCVPADGTIDAKLFTDGGETCNQISKYMSRGRLSLQYQCNRTGNGQFSQSINGKFTADSFEGQAITSTFFSGDGDYQMTRTITGKRVGECSAAQG